MTTGPHHRIELLEFVSGKREGTAGKWLRIGENNTLNHP
jgi:hypothetical protein